MKTISTAVTALLLAAPVLAQSTSQLRAELKQQEASAKDDASKLIELAKWAKDKGLINDYRRLVNAVLKLDPENEAAYTLKGWVKYDGKWMTKSKARLLEKKKLEAEMKAKGYVEVDGVWVTKDEVADAKRGIFRHDGELCNREEKRAFMAGDVRHPVTGQMIPGDDLDKARDGLFPVGDDEWASESEADKHHADRQHPWVYRTHHGSLISTLPLATVKEMAPMVDEAIEAVLPLFGHRHPTPGNRPYVVLAADGDTYRQYGEAVGAEGSSGYGCFLAQQEVQIGDLTCRPAVVENRQGWAPYWLRHAAAMAFAHGHCVDVGAEVPLWFLRGVGSLAERHYNDGIASFFGKQHVQKGGVQNLKGWFGSFQISGELEPSMNDFNVFQAGLVLSFCMYGNDKASTEAVQAVPAAFEKDGKTLERSLDKLEKTVVKKEDELRTFLQAVTAK